MRSTSRRSSGRPTAPAVGGRAGLALVSGLLVIAMGAVAACGTSTASASPPATGPAAGSSTPGASGPVVTPQPTPTEVPGGASTPPDLPPSRIPTTQTDWGEILDAVPAGFPVYPGTKAAEPPAEPVSAAYIAPAGVDDVATWYRDHLEAIGFATTGLSDPLEDGSRVLDSQGDLPECRIQTTFRPANGSTMITVLYGSGCAGGGG